MTATVYNGSIAAGVLLIGAGVAMWSVPGALVTVGALVIILAVFAAAVSRR